MRLCALFLLLLPGCDWSAADGPWNHGDDDDAVGFTVQGSVCVPDGLRGAPAVAVRWSDTLEQEVFAGTTDPWGDYSVPDLAGGRYTVTVGDGVFGAVGVANVESDAQLPSLCLDRSRPQALVLRTELASATDLIDARLLGLGLEHVHEGPSDAADAGQLLGSPAGLVDYGVVAVAGELDFDALAAEPGALDGLREFLGRGGGLYLSGEAWPLLELLAPGRVTPSGVEGTGFFEATVVNAALADSLQWDRVGLRLDPGALLFEPSEDVAVLLEADVAGAVPVLLRTDVEGGTVVLSSFLAAAPRPGEWWIGEPDGQTLPDGSWDGRGAVLDRVVLDF